MPGIIALHSAFTGKTIWKGEFNHHMSKCREPFIMDTVTGCLIEDNIHEARNHILLYNTDTGELLETIDASWNESSGSDTRSFIRGQYLCYEEQCRVYVSPPRWPWAKDLLRISMMKVVDRDTAIHRSVSFDLRRTVLSEDKRYCEAHDSWHRFYVGAEWCMTLFGFIGTSNIMVGKRVNEDMKSGLVFTLDVDLCYNGGRRWKNQAYNVILRYGTKVGEEGQQRHVSYEPVRRVDTSTGQRNVVGLRREEWTQPDRSGQLVAVECYNFVTEMKCSNIVS